MFVAPTAAPEGNARPGGDPGGGCFRGRRLEAVRTRVHGRVRYVAMILRTGQLIKEHIGLCLACRGCESACPSGVPYGRMVEDARAQIEAHVQRGPVARRLHRFVFERLLPSPRMLSAAGTALYLYEASGLKLLTRGLGMMHLLGRLGALVELAPSAEPPFFFRQIGRVFPAEGKRRYSVAFVAGCIANVAFARLNEATVRVLQKNGCEVTISAEQVCCGALHLHSGLRAQAEDLARRNVEAFSRGSFDAIITNAAGCGSTLKEYGALLGTEAATRLLRPRTRCDRVPRVHRIEPRHEESQRCRHVSGFLSSGAWPAHPHRAAEIAGIGSRHNAARNARGRFVLRQRGHLQHYAK